MIPLNHNLAALRRSPIRAYTNLANAIPGCIKLTIGEPEQDTPENIRAAAAAALEAGKTHYAPNQGIPALRQAVAEFETGRGHTVSADQVLITVGATQGLYTALTGMLNPGEEVIIPAPGFVLYESIVLAAGGVPKFLDLSKTDFQIRQQSLLPLVTEKTKAIILNSPNNPTGVVLDEESLAAVKAAILGKPIFLICDNVYQALCDIPCPCLSTDPELDGQVLVSQSFSKPWAMTGWRVGYLTAPRYVMDRLLLLSAATIASVPTFVQHAAVGVCCPAAAGDEYLLPQPPGRILCIRGYPPLWTDQRRILHTDDQRSGGCRRSRQLLRRGGLRSPFLLLL